MRTNAPKSFGPSSPAIVDSDDVIAVNVTLYSNNPKPLRSSKKQFI
jgi:hypothetical protein